MNFKVKVILMLKILALTACGGGSGSSSTSASVTEQTFYGYLSDSAMEGVRYETASSSGYTNSEGRFEYKSFGEKIKFFIGGIALPEVTATTFISPSTFSDTFKYDGTYREDYSLINLLVLFQSLDDDMNPSNGIKIPTTIRSNFGYNIDFTEHPEIFAESTALLDALEEIHGIGSLPVTQASALAHYSTLPAQNELSSNELVVDAGQNISTEGSKPFIINGSLSENYSNDNLLLSWSIINTPDNGDGNIYNINSISPTLYLNTPGVWDFRLEATSDSGVTSYDTVTVEVTTAPPKNKEFPFKTAWINFMTSRFNGEKFDGIGYGSKIGYPGTYDGKFDIFSSSTKWFSDVNSESKYRRLNADRMHSHTLVGMAGYNGIWYPHYFSKYSFILDNNKNILAMLDAGVLSIINTNSANIPTIVGDGDGGMLFTGKYYLSEYGAPIGTLSVSYTISSKNSSTAIATITRTYTNDTTNEVYESLTSVFEFEVNGTISCLKSDQLILSSPYHTKLVNSEC